MTNSENQSDKIFDSYAQSVFGLRCVCCMEEISIGALKCLKCGSFQNWTRHVFQWSSLIAAGLAVIPLGGIAISLWKLAIPADAELKVSILANTKSEISIAATNAGQKSGLIRKIDLNVIRNPPSQDTARDARSILTDYFTSIKPNDTIVLKLRPSAQGFEELPSFQDSKTCQYLLTFELLGSKFPITATCDCPR